MKKRYKTIKGLIALAGSETKLAASLNCHLYVVAYWGKSGIPLKYWDAIIKLYGLTPGELYNIYQSACRDKAK